MIGNYASRARCCFWFRRLGKDQPPRERRSHQAALSGNRTHIHALLTIAGPSGMTPIYRARLGLRAVYSHQRWASSLHLKPASAAITCPLANWLARPSCQANRVPNQSHSPLNNDCLALLERATNPGHRVEVIHPCPTMFPYHLVQTH